MKRKFNISFRTSIIILTIGSFIMLGMSLYLGKIFITENFGTNIIFPLVGIILGIALLKNSPKEKEKTITLLNKNEEDENEEDETHFSKGEFYGSPGSGIQFSFFDLAFEDFLENDESTKYLNNYKTEIFKKDTIIEANAYLSITQSLLAYLTFDPHRIREIEKNISEDYTKEKITLEKISRVFKFFEIKKTDEIKQKYEEWIEEWVKRYLMKEHTTKPLKPVFEKDRKNGYVVSEEFLDYIYKEIINLNY